MPLSPSITCILHVRILHISLTGVYAVTTLLGGSPGYSDGYTQLVPSLWLMCGGEGATCGMAL